MTARTCDILIVGGGMAGFSLAALLGVKARVLLIEQEAQPAYHATGRSVAFWNESYGGPGVQPLTTASGPLLESPDPALSDRPFVSPRGAIHVGRAEDAALAQALQAEFAGSGVAFSRLSEAELIEAIPGLQPGWTVGLAEPSCTDIDVAALLGAYRGAARRGGVEIALSTKLVAAQQLGSGWRVETSSGTIDCAILVNAAGAWADEVALAAGVGALGITPFRRTVVQLRCAAATRDLPLIEDLGGKFYFKPEGDGHIWLSPHDEIPDMARDVAPEELDVAIAIDRLQSVVDWQISKVEHKWAGLRSFAPDRLPVYGFDPRAEGFFWFAGQGGFGIQTAPAAALIGAALLLGETLPKPVEMIDPTRYSPRRLLDNFTPM